ncbi:MAG TPA: glutamine amidotransferase [Opitutaceae bacterium]|nr:glutamine amidotransferase [Opitutaceae bacterium]
MPPSLTFSSAQWIWPAAIFLVVALLVLAWSYRASAGQPLRWTCLLLKALGLTALAVCLLEPLWLGQRPRPGANLFAIVADNSQGLQIRDQGDAKTRGENLRALVDPQATGWQSVLGDTFELRRYTFDARLQATIDFKELNFEGRSSAIGAALRTLGERFQGRPLAGVLMLTDGNATDLPGGTAIDLRGLPPIYPVVIGKRDAVSDIAVQQVNVTQSSFEDAPVSMQADVMASGFRGRPVTARLIDRGGRVVQEQVAEARGDGESIAFRFQVKPEQPGLSFYQVRVSTKAPPPPAEGDTAPPRSEEATLANNARVVAVDRGQGPYRILYVSGRPNWEFKFLNRAVQEDAQVQLVGLIRVAKREPKFDFRGRAGETSNPLFRGFGAQGAEEVQRYDQPVMVRLNVRDETELRSSGNNFPRTAEELYGYHAVILDDLEAEFFAPEQAQLLQKFVSERGGGFLMLGGMESFGEGKYFRTPVGDMLPVYLDRDETPAPEVAGSWQLQLAREGWLQPWARLRDNEADEKARLEGMPALQVFNRVRSLKPGASVIATVRDEKGGEFPALAVQRFGRGRTAALMLGDIWRWGMRDATSHADMDKGWRQLVRWLVADVPNRVQTTVEPIAQDANGAVRVQVRVRDEKFQPVDDAAVAVDIEPVVFEGTAGAAGTAIKLEAEPALTEPGLYQATYVPRQTGGYKAMATVKNNAGADLGRGEAGWSTDLAAEEFRSLVPNTALLEDIAKKTGGQVVAIDELERFARRLPQLKAPVMETWSYPAWHTPVMFAFALACLLSEWGLRRWKGMP